MRELWPTPSDAIAPERLAALCTDPDRPAPAHRPWVVVNMIASVDGATAVDGRSGGLGGPGDRAVFRALRAAADVILVGAATVRAERYGPPTLPAPALAARRAEGRPPTPRLAIVSGRLDLPADSPALGGDGPVPYVFTTDGRARDAGALSTRAEVVEMGRTAVDLSAVLGHLHDDGARVVLSEGGPSLNGQLVAAGLVDEWCQSVAPVLVAGASARVAHGTAPGTPDRLRLAHLLEDDGFLFARYTAV